LLFSNPTPGRSNDVFGVVLVGTSGTATAAKQALAQIFQDLGLETNVTFQHRVGQCNLAASDPSLALLDTEYRTVGAARTTLDAMFDLFAIIFKFFELCHNFRGA
jgi:hypothetical protein